MSLLKRLRAVLPKWWAARPELWGEEGSWLPLGPIGYPSLFEPQVRIVRPSAEVLRQTLLILCLLPRIRMAPGGGRTGSLLPRSWMALRREPIVADPGSQAILIRALL